MRKPPTQKRRETSSPRKAIPKVVANTISPVRKIPPSQLLQYRNPWIIRSWGSTGDAAIPQTISQSIPETGIILSSRREPQT